jgi:hypothetical protein
MEGLESGRANETCSQGMLRKELPELSIDAFLRKAATMRREATA